MIDSCSNTFLSQPHITTVSLNTGPSQWLTGVAGLLTLYASPPGYSKHMKHIHNLPLYNKIRSKLERLRQIASIEFLVLNLFIIRFLSSQLIFLADFWVLSIYFLADFCVFLNNFLEDFCAFFYLFLSRFLSSLNLFFSRFLRVFLLIF